MDMVSILIPSYKPTYFTQALISAISQTWKNKEIIVSDDCPTNAIKEICDKFGDLVSYHRNPNPDGKGGNNHLNLLKLAKGDYCKFLCDDDILDPSCVENLIQGSQRHEPKNVNLIFSARATIDAENNFLKKIDYFQQNGDVVISGLDMMRFMAINCCNPIGEPTTILFKTNSIPHDKKLWSIDDLNFEINDLSIFMHLLPRGNVLKVDGILSYFRMNSESTSHPENNSEWGKLVTVWSNIIRYADRNKILSPEQKVQAFKRYRKTVISNLPRAEHLLEEFTESVVRLKYDLQIQQC